MSGRPMPFRSGDDAARAAVAPLLDDLRAELLVLPREDIVDKHLDMMAFEQRVLSTPRVDRPARKVWNRPRRTAFVLGCIAATITSCGLSAAGALPEPLQHITDSIAHTLGVPQPHDSGTSTGAGPTAPDATEPVQPRIGTPTTEPASATTPTTTPKAAASKPHDTTPTTEAAPPTTTPVPTTLPPAFPARPTDPGGRVDPMTPTTTPEPPSNNSDNTPPGYPANWRDQAANSTAAQILFCSWWNDLAPANCPQSAVAPGATDVQWRLLSDPARTAAVVAKTTKDANGDPSTLVTVYERFRMVATYTLADTGTTQHLAYSSGIAQATMSWNGTAFQDVRLTTGSVAGHVMPGVTVPTFSRPNIWDFQVSYAVQRAFERCTANGTLDRCPAGGLLDAPTTNQSTLNGDILSSAEVSFDGASGLYQATGPYSLTPPSGPPVDGIFTATLFWDGDSLTILSVTGS